MVTVKAKDRKGKELARRLSSCTQSYLLVLHQLCYCYTLGGKSVFSKEKKVDKLIPVAFLFDSSSQQPHHSSSRISKIQAKYHKEACLPLITNHNHPSGAVENLVENLSPVLSILQPTMLYGDN